MKKLLITILIMAFVAGNLGILFVPSQAQAQLFPPSFVQNPSDDDDEFTESSEDICKAAGKTGSVELSICIAQVDNGGTPLEAVEPSTEGTEEVFQDELEYKPLEKLPFIGDGGNDLGAYLEGIFKLLLSLSILFTVVMVTWGGILYITTDAIGGKSEGKSKITQALLGLLLALISWLILNTINPDLLLFDLNPGESASEAEIEAAKKASGGS